MRLGKLNEAASQWTEISQYIADNFLGIEN
jgi:hypothetical protein